MTALASTSCSFDNGLCCDWQQSITDVFDWTINTGSTGSLNTGPDHDHTSGLGKKTKTSTAIDLNEFSAFRSPYDTFINERVFYSMQYLF